MWAIGALAAVLLITIAREVPEIVTGVLGLGFIVAALISSVAARRERPAVLAEPAESISA
jgi:hypothetical protein